MKSESQEQIEVISWARAMARKVPALKWLHAIPNGGFRNPREARKLKLEGVTPGIPDLFLPAGAGVGGRLSLGLYIEMKAKNGRLSKAQKDFAEYARLMGYQWFACYGADEAIATIRGYLEIE